MWNQTKLVILIPDSRGNRRKRECPEKNGGGGKSKKISHVWEHGLRLHEITKEMFTEDVKQLLQPISPF